MLMKPTRQTDSQTKFSGNSRHVTAAVWVGKPAEVVPVTDEQSKDFTEDVFEDALDKASRSVKGKYADVMPSTEEFIRQRREEEAEVEDR